MHLDHYSTRGLQVTFKRTKLVKPDLFAGLTNDTGFYFLAGRRYYFVTVHSFDWLYANEALLIRNYLGVPLRSKV